MRIRRGSRGFIRARLFPSILVLALSATVSGGRASATGVLPACPLSSPSSFPVGLTPAAIAAADFDEDGILDLAVANSGSNSVSVLRGNGASGVGDGTFVLAAQPWAGGAALSVASADFNSDGILDLVAAGLSGVYILLGNGSGGMGNGTFGAASYVAGSSQSSDVVIGDFYEDGILDLAVANEWRVRSYRGQGSNGVGDGTFAFDLATPIDGIATKLATSDFNADGIADLAVARSNGSTGISILLGNGINGVGDGTFRDHTSYSPADLYDVATGDFNEDGVTDLVASRTGAVVFTFQGIFGGYFQPGNPCPTSSSPQDVGVADVNGDGIADLIVACNGGNTVDVLPGLGVDGVGNGAFDFAQAFNAGNGPYGLVLGDVLEDGAPDVIVTNNNFNSVSTLLGTCTSGLSTSIQVVSPNGGDDWQVDQTVTISWTKGGGVLATNVELSRDDGANWQTIANDVTGTTIGWTVTLPTTQNARVRVSDATITTRSDVSDASFDIAPNASWGACGTTVGTTLGIPFPEGVSTVSDGAGGAFVAWHSVNRVTAQGSIAPGWPANGVLAFADSTRFTADLVPDGSGGVFAYGGGLCQRFTQFGGISPGWPIGGVSVPGLGGQGGNTASDGAGGLFMTTYDRLQRVDGTGAIAAGWPPNGVIFNFNAYVEDMIPDGGGGVFCALDEDDDSVVRIAGDGTVLWQTPIAGESQLAGDGTGGVFVATVNGAQAVVHRLQSNGTTVPGWPVVLGPSSPGINGGVWDAKSDGLGGVLVCWVYTSAPNRLALQRLMPNGSVAPGWPAGGVKLGPAGQEQRLPETAPDGMGGAFLFWMDRTMPSPAPTPMWAARIGANGSVAPGWPADGLEVCSSGNSFSSNVQLLSMAADDARGAFACWYRKTATTGSAGTIQLMRLGSDPPSIGAAVVSAGSPSTTIAGNVTVTFGTVTTAGELYFGLTTGPQPPAGDQTVPAAAPAVYELATTAVYSGDVDVCIEYDPADVAGAESGLRLLHYEGPSGPPEWVDITTGVDVNANRICGRTTSLSPFAIVETDPTSDALVPRASLRLHQNHPNPFNPTTAIAYEIPARGHVQLRVYDVRGRLVRTLAERVEDAGPHQVIWSGDDQHGVRVASGVYFYRLGTPQRSLTRRMVLLK